MPAEVEFNPFAPELHEDPYPAYRRMRELDPVHQAGWMGAWVLTAYADCLALLRNPRFSSERTRDPTLVPPGRSVYRSMLFSDPPDHTRLRGLVNKAFSARMIESLRPRVEELASELLDALPEGQAVDWIQAFAYPLPVMVIAEMLGIPAADRPRFQGWSQTLAKSLDPIFEMAEVERTFEARDSLFDYFRPLIAARRRRPQSDLISALAAAEEAGDALSEAELLSMLNLLLIAGHETTVNLLGNGLLALLRHPGEVARLRAEPELVDSGVEEVLRFDPPVQLDGRVALEGAEVAGLPVPAGTPVIAVVAAANRDPEVFPDPDRFDVGRHPNRHLAFGMGIHFCLGAPLARLEGQVAFRLLLERFRSIELAGEPELRPTIVLRGRSRLPIRLYRGRESPPAA